MFLNKSKCYNKPVPILNNNNRFPKSISKPQYRNINLNLEDLMGVNFKTIPRKYRNQKTVCKCKTVPLKSFNKRSPLKMDRHIQKLMSGNVQKSSRTPNKKKNFIKSFK